MELNKISTLVAGFLIELILGCYFIWGFISVYVFSYYKVVAGNDISFDTINVSYIVGNFFTALSMPFGVRLCKKITFRFAYLLFGTFMSACFFLSSLFSNFWLFFLFYACLFNVGQGMLWVVPPFIASKLYPSHKGILSGIMLCGYALGSSIAGFLFSFLINPENVSPITINNEQEFSEEIAKGFPYTMKILSAYLLGLTILSFILLRVKGLEKEEINSYERNQSIECLSVIESIHSENLELPEKEKLISNEKTKERPNYFKDTTFWCFFFMNTILNIFHNFLVSNYKSYGLIKIKDDHFISTIGSIAFVFNAGARILWGKLIDHFKLQHILRGIFTFELFLTITIDFISSSKVLYFIYISFGLICQACGGSLFTAACLMTYGFDEGAKVFGYVYYGSLVANTTQYLFTKFVLPLVGYRDMFFIFAELILVNLILTYVDTDKKKKVKNNQSKEENIRNTMG